MRVRFGYVAMALSIPEGSPNKTVTVSNLMKIADPADRLSKLRRIAKTNLENQMRVLRYNRAHDIHVFRFTSNLFPLATHPIVGNWNVLTEFGSELKAIGDYVKQHNMRVSAHPDHFALLNSPRDEVIAAAVKDINYHTALFEAMGLSHEAKLVLHVGGTYKYKSPALERFKANFKNLPENIRQRITLENDDKSYTAQDVLNLCQKINIPMVLDVHHHMCCHNNEDLAGLLPAIFSTWKELSPKVHLSSPKSTDNMRAHADYVDAGQCKEFLSMVKEVLDKDLDIMIEAKQKDVALKVLIEELAGMPGIKISG